jgi:hypothetical protein
VTIEMTGLCRDHSFEPAADLCRMCGAEFCEGCLVYPFRKPLCKTCAIAAAGVRAAGSPKPLKKADIRKRLKAFEEAQEARRSSDAPALMPTKPLSSYDLIGQTTGRDPDGPAETDGTGDPELASPAAAELVGSAGEGASVSESPGGDVAPPVDWNNPFG